MVASAARHVRGSASRSTTVRRSLYEHFRKRKCTSTNLDSSRLAVVQRALSSFDVSPSFQVLFLGAISVGTRKSYDRGFACWAECAKTKRFCVYDLDDAQIINCLTFVFEKTRSRANLENARSAIGSVTELFTTTLHGVEPNKSFIQAQIQKGMARRKPDVVRHVSQFDVTKVFCHFKTFPFLQRITEEQVGSALATCMLIESCGEPGDLLNLYREKVFKTNYGRFRVITASFKDPKKGSRTRKSFCGQRRSLWNTSIRIVDCAHLFA